MNDYKPEKFVAEQGGKSGAHGAIGHSVPPLWRNADIAEKTGRCAGHMFILFW